VFFNIKPPTLGNTILLLVLNFEINLIIIGQNLWENNMKQIIALVFFNIKPPTLANFF